MKSLTLITLALLSTALFFGCKKNEYNNNPNTNPDPNAMVYIINGITDLNIKHKGSVTLPLSVERTSGNQENITLSVEGLPGQTTATFSPASGIPNFATTLTINTNYTDGGNYTIALKGTTASGAAKTYNLKLNVTAEPALGCVADVVSNYNSHYEGSGLPLQSESIEATTTKNYVKFLPKAAPEFYGTLDCDLHKIDIKFQQTSTGEYLMGNGSYDDKNITLNIFFRNAANTQTTYNYIVYMAKK